MATFDYNPITGNLDLVGSGASYIDGVVADSSLLPTTLGTPPLDAVYLAKAGSGVWLINRKPAGLYCRVANNGNAADWTHLGAFPEVNADGNWELYNSTDPTKELKFDLSGLPTATTRTVTAPAGNGQMLVEGQSIGSTTRNTGAFTTLSANNGTLTASAPVLDLSQTWNNSGVTFTGLRFNVTNTASAAASLIADFQVGGSSMFSVSRAGTITVQSDIITSASTVVQVGNSPRITLSGVDGTFLALHANHEIRWATGRSDQAAANPSLILVRDGANDILAQRRTTNAQTFRLYNTYTSATNFERLNVRWASNELILDAEAGSAGGTLRGIKIGSATSSLLGFYGVTPVDQPATVADPAGGGTVDTEARTAINAIIDRLQELGLIA